jgi:hypothetical protein
MKMNHRYKRQNPTMPTVTAQFILPDMDHFGGCGQSDIHRAGRPGTVGGFGESLLIGKGRSNAESIGARMKDYHWKKYTEKWIGLAIVSLLSVP